MLDFLPHGALRLVGNINKEQWWWLWGNAMTVTGNYWFRWDVAVFSVEVTVTMGTWWMEGVMCEKRVVWSQLEGQM